jgi:signal transduction histidine kinase/DNA-binding response OmpR family regulator
MAPSIALSPSWGPQPLKEDGLAGELVLLVDDRKETRESLIDRVLVPNGYRWLVAEDNPRGIQQAIHARPDLVLLSPGASALPVLKALQQAGRLPPVILSVPHSAKDPVLQALQVQAQGTINPFAVDETLAAIEGTLQASRVRQERGALEGQLQLYSRKHRILQAVGQAIPSLTDHQQALNRLAEAATYVTGADEGSVLLKDSDTGEVHLRAHLDDGAQHARAEKRIVQDWLARRVLESGEPLLVSGQEAAWATDGATGAPSAGAPAQGVSTAAGPAPAVMEVPIKAWGRPTGVLRVVRLAKSRREDDSRSAQPAPGFDANANAFSADDLASLVILAGYAALSIENAHLRSEIMDGIEWTAICQIGASFSATLHLDKVLDTVMQVAIRIVNAERGYVALADEESGRYTPHAVHAASVGQPRPAEFPFGAEIVRRVLQEGKPIQTTAAVDASRSGGTGVLRAVLCIPILGAAGVMGAIYVDHHDHIHYFREHHQEVLTALAANAAAAVANARLFHQVEAEQRRLEAVIRGTGQPVIITDVLGTVLLMNSAAHLAFSTRGNKATGMLLPQISAHPTLDNLFSQARASGNVQHGEIQLGNERTFSASVTPIPGVGFVAMMQDITELKQLSQMKTEFVATVSHDLRSPLNVVLGILSVLDQAGPLTEQQREFISNAQQEVQHLFSLTDDLLDLGRLEADIDVEMTPIDVRDLVANALEHWQSMSQQVPSRLSVDLPAQPVWAYGNAGRLRQVIDNLLSNAVKYTPNEGRIVVRLAQEGQELVLRVRDSGIGISHEDQPYVFDRFYRVHNKQTQDIAGTGLGLAIVKSIVERHKGRVWLESELGEGSAFNVALPALQA